MNDLNAWTGNWWALGLRAAAAILLGIIALTVPGVTLAAIVTMFGIYAIADGLFAIIAAVRGVRRHERWVAMLFEGIIGVAAGTVALFWPAIGALALTYLVAGWAMATGIFEIAAAVRLRKIMTGEWLLMIGGALSILLAIGVALFPGVGMVFLVWWLGAYALAYGLVSLVLAIRVRRWVHANA
jgi:uncharacterized membrane protein HdeD (DUF308 family)